MKDIASRIRNRLLRPYGWIKSQKQRFFSKNKKENYPIDFVVTWVDGSDKEWQKRKALYLDKDIDEIANSAARYRDWDLMHFWFRAVEKYAPWVRKVFFVTCGQKPSWLNLENEKLEFITHDEFIPSCYLPTFNSSTIELNLWRIPSLSEHFVYFNDDMFLNRPVLPSDFFENGLPKLCALAVPFCFHGERKKQCWRHMLLNDIGVINDSFNIQQVIRKYPEKFFPYVYPRQTRYNRRILEDNYLTGMHHTHSVQIYLKSVFPEIWEKQYDILDKTCLIRFRNENQVTSFLPTLWQVFKGSFIPVQQNYFGKAINLSANCLPVLQEAICSDDRIICLNDNEVLDLESDEQINILKEKMRQAMIKKLPEVSSYENE